MFRFKEGRQKTGYQKLCLLSFWFFDVYILKYMVGSSIPKHIDKVAGKKHWRINYEIKRAIRGGNFIGHADYFKLGNLYVFRSDIVPHEVTKIEEGTRLVLSIGVAL